MSFSFEKCPKRKLYAQKSPWGLEQFPGLGRGGPTLCLPGNCCVFVGLSLGLELCHVMGGVWEVTSGKAAS